MSRHELSRFANGFELARAAAGEWLNFIESRRALPICSMALSGGRISASLYRSFAEQAAARSLPRENLMFFWADERCVPPDHADSNFKVAQAHLFHPLRIPEARVHRILGEQPPEAAAALATAEIRALLPGSPLPQLDLILLGMGEDGHVASLFPGSAQCQSPGGVYCSVKGPKPPPDRVTLSYAMVAAAKEVWVLISGEGKANALRESLAPSGTTPLARVIRSRQHTRIFAEEANIA